MAVAKTKKAKPAAPKSNAKPQAKPATTAPDKLIGKAAPAFDLPATVIGRAKSAGMKGKPYILYFYPKDDTSGCTVEACDFRDAIPSFGKLGLTVIGISKDSLASHEKFAAKHDLQFPLASDEGSNLCEKFGVYVEKIMYGRKYMGIERSTFLIDGKGIVRAAWRKVSVPGHVAEVAKAAKEL